MARRFGASSEVHTQAAQDEIREVKRLLRSLRSHMKSPPDCERAAGLAFTLARMSGAYTRDVSHSTYKWRMKGALTGTRKAIDKFISACVVKPRSPTAARKMRSVWR